jgi:hypothetical protein
MLQPYAQEINIKTHAEFSGGKEESARTLIATKESLRALLGRWVVKLNINWTLIEH